MSKFNLIRKVLLGAALLAASLNLVQAQTTAIWTGPASGGEWNTGANWNTGLAPADLTTNAFIGVGTNVNYNLPMTAGTIGALTNFGLLTVNTNGLVVGASGNTAVLSSGSGVRILVNSGGVMTLTNGGLTLTNIAALVVSTGGVFTASGTLSVGAGSGNGTDKAGLVTNNSGTIKVGGLKVTPNTGNANSRVVVNGGTNEFGDVVIQRSNITTWNTPGVEGLLIYGGFVKTTSLDVGGANADATATMLVANGVVTNTGAFTIRQKTAARPSRFMQTGGFFISTNNDGVHLRGQPAANAIVGYSVTGGTNVVSGFLAADPGDLAGTLNFTNAANIYVGSAGFSNNTLTAINVALNAGGLFGAQADWVATVPMILGGSFTFSAAALDGTAHNLTLNGGLSGGINGVLNKAGGGVLTLNATNTYTGRTIINSGSVVLGATGSLSNSAAIIVGSGTTLDVSAVSGGFVVNAAQTLAGSGVVTGAVTVAAGGFINPGSNALTGGLTFSNSVTEAGLATNHFDLAAAPGPNNDLITIAGNFTVSATNVIEITGGLAGQVYPLIQYGSFTGDLTNFALTATGLLSNSVAAKTIFFISLNTTRAPTNIVWLGNALTNNWDLTVTTNWVNGAALDYFIPGDNARFDGRGATNSLVTLVGSLAAGSVTVDTGVSNYVFTGNGSIGERLGFPANLTKTNSSTLTILTTNNYTGITTIGGGVLEVAQIASNGVPSALGSADNLVVGNATLRYTGGSVATDRGATLSGTNSTWDITNSATTLTPSGTLTGSGALIKTGEGNLNLPVNNNYGGGTLLNAGTLTLNSAAAAGSGNLTLNGGTLALGAVKPANTINVNGPATITGGNNGGSTGIRNVTGSSNLLLVVAGGSTFDLTGDMTAYSGTITLNNGGGQFVRFNGATGSALATWDLGTGNNDLNIRSGSTVNTFGALTGGSSTTLSGRGGASNNGPTTHHVGANGLNSTFDGIIRDGSGGGSSLTHIVKTGAGTLTLSGVNTYTGTTVVSNGVLALTGSGSIGTSSSINLIAGAAVDVSSQATPALALGSAQTLKGNGTVNGSLDASGTVSPGASIGKLTVTNIATLLGTTYMELNRTNSVQTNDILAAASIVLGGTLTVTNVGPTLVAGDRFVLFSGPVSGAFAVTNLPENLGSVTYTWTNKIALDGSIQVLTVTSVNQNPTNITAVVNGGSLELSWPADHTGWHLQSQTNSLADGLGTNWVTIPNTDLSNSHTNTLDAANGAVFYRMVYP